MVKVVGKKIGIFADENGVALEYAKLYVLTDPPKDDCVYEGLVPDTYSISKALVEEIPVGSSVILYVNSKGKITNVTVLDEDD